MARGETPFTHLSEFEHPGQFVRVRVRVVLDPLQCLRPVQTFTIKAAEGELESGKEAKPSAPPEPPSEPDTTPEPTEKDE